MATTKTTPASAQTTIPTPATAPALDAPTTPAVTNSPTNVLSVSSLVIAIVSFVVAQPWLAIVAIVLGFFGRNREPAAVTTANWGIVLGFVSLFGGFVLAAVGIAALVPLAIGGALWGW